MLKQLKIIIIYLLLKEEMNKLLMIKNWWIELTLNFSK